MMEIALNYFDHKNINEINAFFHIFGMSCYARHGKLHDSAFYIEKLLSKYSIKKEHENAYFSLNLVNEHYNCDPEIFYELTGNGNKIKIEFYVDRERICYGELAFLHGNIGYLYYIEIDKKLRNKGWGTKCMNILFHILKSRNYLRIDLDTIDSNIIAQKFYQKLGFQKKGITRSYSNKA